MKSINSSKYTANIQLVWILTKLRAQYVARETCSLKYSGATFFHHSQMSFKLDLHLWGLIMLPLKNLAKISHIHFFRFKIWLLICKGYVDLLYSAANYVSLLWEDAWAIFSTWIKYGFFWNLMEKYEIYILGAGHQTGEHWIKGFQRQTYITSAMNKTRMFMCFQKLF